jgi:hypothetical protein
MKAAPIYLSEMTKYVRLQLKLYPRMFRLTALSLTKCQVQTANH